MPRYSLYRKYRPDTWDKVIGQDHIVRTLVNQIKTGTVSHAYLFTGTRGTGKTSSAKIFARAINCPDASDGSPCGVCPVCKAISGDGGTDIIEMDAASNRSVDDIRELRENVQYPPTVGKYKVYIIDEVHMLTTEAFNALLKTLEEPPKHAVFILATTDVGKIPQTVLSRCMRFDFRLVPKDTLAAHLKSVFKSENYPFEDGAVELIARHGEGSVRDMLSLADMCMSYAPQKLTEEAALEVLGASDFNTLYRIAEAVLSDNIPAILTETEYIASRGKGIAALNKELCSFFRDLIAIKNVKGFRAGLSESEYNAAATLASRFDNYRISRIMGILADAENSLRFASRPEIIFDSCLVRAAELITETDVEALRSRVSELEKELSGIKKTGILPAPQAETKEPEADIPSVLSAYVTPDEDAKGVVFETEEEPSASDRAEASRIVGRMLTIARETGATIIYRALSYQQNFDLSGKVLTVKVAETANYLALSDENGQKTLSALIKRAAGEDYEIKIISTDVQKRKVPEEDRRKLADLFDI